MNRRIFVIAGEASGDEHAASLIRTLKQTYPTLTIHGIGGKCMEEAGATILYPLAQYGVTGLTEIIKQRKHISKAYQLAKAHIETQPVDLLILVDYPGFNLRFAKMAKRRGLTILYYISPQLWAWKPKRIHCIKANVDAMAVIFPFEKQIYQQANVPVYFVGHPLSERTSKPVPQPPEQSAKTRIGIIPGSRPNEIHALLPVMLNACKLLHEKYADNIEFVLPRASTISEELINAYLTEFKLPLKVVSNAPLPELLQNCHSVMVASGTASLEVALMHIPMVIIYRTSYLTYAIATQVIRCRYLGLCNLLAGKMIVPELVQQDLTPKHLFLELDRYLSNPSYHQHILQVLKNISIMLENKSVDCKLAHLVASMLRLPQVGISFNEQNDGISQITSADEHC